MRFSTFFHTNNILHIELDGDLREVKDKAGIKYGVSISRDILIPSSIPLHNLDYAINEAFGFTHSHLHEFTLFDDDLFWITQNSTERWKKMLGLVFKNPLRDENVDFWDDDYDGGSPKKWMRSKYTGPWYRKAYEESYRYVQKEIKDEVFKEKTIEELKGSYGYDFYPLSLSENIKVGEILSPDGHQKYKDINEYDDLMKKSIKDAKAFPERSLHAIPRLYPFVDKLYYTYDFGDNWNFVITPHNDIKYLKKRVKAENIKEAVKTVLTLTRPVVVAADGLPLIEDVGGIYGYIDFMNGEGVYEDEEESLEWTRGNGWSGKIGSLKTLL